MSRPVEGQVLVYAPGLDNAGTIVSRLRGAGIDARARATASDLEAGLVEDDERLGAVLITASGVRRGGGGAIARFKAREPTWSALPIVLLAPPGSAAYPPWPHTTLITTPATTRQLVDVVGRAVAVRGHQFILAYVAHDLRQAALQDSLTGLPNRSALYQRIRELQADRRSSATEFAAVFIDVDGFKRFNDDYGHVAGDEVLRHVAAHLVAAVRATDFVARWAGDEFMVLLVGEVGADLIAETVQRLGQGIEMRLQSVSLPVTVSFSVGHLGDITPDKTPDEILAGADERMYAEKHARRRDDR
ncbi:MAG: GGDEF domain-containing protein [Trueperaceae bacterium]|nr:GGDEF domain-containing protein [Trueperaceae bacterium]